ncbi:MAG: imidazole glycerol phosphate synthase subunit HisH [Candidatus Thorarchaeota archaeon]
MKATIISLGAGNLLSIQRGFERAGLSIEMISSPTNMKDTSCIILPGVGNFGYICEQLEPFRDLIIAHANDGLPLFGICLGMQLLFERSEEGDGKGLGLFEGESRRFGDSLIVPHMGWNGVQIEGSSELLENTDSGTDFYFIHSYYIPITNSREEIGITEYGTDFVSIIQRENIIGTQFHPERSGIAGRILIEDFVEFLRR